MKFIAIFEDDARVSVEANGFVQASEKVKSKHEGSFTVYREDEVPKEEPVRTRTRRRRKDTKITMEGGNQL